MQEGEQPKFEVRSKKENEFPRDLDGRLNALLNVANSELKLLTLLHLDGDYASGSDIRRRVKSTVGRVPYLPQSKSFRTYCHYSLNPIGAVAQAELIPVLGSKRKVFTGYKITEAGNRYGQPVAIFTLDYAVRTGRSMFEILGSTGSSGESRSPLNSVKILEQLDSFGEVRVVDLASLTLLNSGNVVDHLRALLKVGFVDFDSVEAEEKFSEYEWIEGEDPTKVYFYKEPKLEKDMANALSTFGRLKINEVAALVGKEEGDANVVTHLSHLVRTGFARRVSQWDYDRKSKVKLLDSGRRFLGDYVIPLRDALQDGASLEMMQEFYEDLTSDKDRFGSHSRAAIELYRKVSPIINKKSSDERRKSIIRHLIQNPDESRPSEIAQRLGLTEALTLYYLTLLVQQKILTKKKGSNMTAYSVEESTVRDLGLI